MPVKKCQKGGKSGYKWGDAGVCFVGSGARTRAVAVGRAIHARRGAAAKGEDVDDLPLSEIESHIASLDETKLGTLMAQLPFHPDELRESWVKKADEEMHLIWGEVYVPDIPDTQNEYMTAPEIRKMAHGFLAFGNTENVDVGHDNVKREGLHIVESFIARKSDPEFIEGAWVVCARVLDEEIWEQVKTGELNGFSMQARVLLTDRIVDVQLPEIVEGLTQVSSDGELHRHKYTVRFDDEGGFKGGYTDVVDGHKHRILRRSVTGPEITATGQGIDGGAFHRYTLLDQIADLGSPESPGIGLPEEPVG